MKLSVQHDTAGLAGHIRSTQTGEVLHFQFPKRGNNQIPFEIVMGDKRLEVFLRIEKVETDKGDDLDMELTLRAPDVAVAASLDYVVKIAPPKAGGKIDTDGAAMDPPEAGEPVIAEAPPVEKREEVLTPAEKDKYAITPTELAIQQATTAEEGLFDGEEQVGSATSEDEHPATQVPELPGVGSDRKAFKKRR